MPSPSKAERNQRRKLSYVPVWPIIAMILIVVAVAIVASR